MKLPGQLFKFNQPQPPGVLRPDPVIILGMHRSGTSALGGALEPLGMTVGKTVMAPQADNPKGFFENDALTQLHEKFLEAIGSNWCELAPISPEKFEGEVARQFRRKLLRLLIDEFGANRPLIKDPRMCRLMPLWIPLIQEHFPLARFVLPIRHPVEVAHSLRKRGHVTLDQGLKLWVVHVLEAERTTRGFPRIFTTYDQLMRSPVETVLRLANDLGLSTNVDSAAVAGQIDAALRHHAEPAWPPGEPFQELTLAIHQALVNGETVEKLEELRRGYYGQMGWRC